MSDWPAAWTLAVTAVLVVAGIGILIFWDQRDREESAVPEPTSRHEPVIDTGQLRLPEDYEADGWDEGREPPKTRDEAAAALDDRIADPSAPDTPAEADAYGREQGR